MSGDLHRRGVLIGLGGAALAACGSRPRTAEALTERKPISLEAFDLSTLERAEGGRLGFVAHDTATGRKLAWRGEERFVYCSTFKAYLAAATLLRVQAGQERLDRPVPVVAADMIHHAPVTELAVGRALTVERLMQATVEVSDNPAAKILIREMGGLDVWRAFYSAIGDTVTRVDRWELELNRLDGDKDTITPLQSAANLHRLFVAAETPLNADSKSRLLDWMFASPTGPGRIKAGVPAGWRVAHKTGTGGYGPVNDIGVLYPPSGSPVVVAAYYHADAASEPARREAVIAEATRRAIAALHG